MSRKMWWACHAIFSQNRISTLVTVDLVLKHLILIAKSLFVSNMSQHWLKCKGKLFEYSLNAKIILISNTTLHNCRAVIMIETLCIFLILCS